MGQHLIRRDRLGVPQGARDVFDLLARGGRIPADLALALQHRVDYRSIAVHEYQKLLLPITTRVITHHLDEFLQFSQALLLRES